MTYRTHLDYASSAPMRDIVRSSIINQLETSNDFYDPRRLYDDSIRIRYEIEESRHQIANFFGAKPSELIFTSSGYESLAMFTHGIAKMDDKKRVLNILTPNNGLIAKSKRAISI